MQRFSSDKSGRISGIGGTAINGRQREGVHAAAVRQDDLPRSGEQSVGDPVAAATAVLAVALLQGAEGAADALLADDVGGNDVFAGAVLAGVGGEGFTEVLAVGDVAAGRAAERPLEGIASEALGGLGDQLFLRELAGARGVRGGVLG